MLEKNSGITMDVLGIFRKLQLQLQEDQHSTGGPITQTRPAADPQTQSASTVNSLNVAPRLAIGRIADGTPIGQVYRVYLEHMKRPMVALYISRTTTTRFGATEFTSLQPGTYVWCCIHAHDSAVTILGAIPPPNVDPARNFSSLLHTSTRARVDTADYAPYNMEDNGGAISFGAGRPYDAILGDYGAMSETGCRVLVDSFMAQLGVTEMSQLTFYHHDMLAKLAAYNYLAWTCCTERESLNDQDEVSDWTGYATYPWEQLGYFKRENPSKTRKALEWQKESPAHSKVEPIDDYAMPFHREREWHGYLGQGGRTAVSGPPQGQLEEHMSFAGGSGSPDLIIPGLYDEFTLLDGRHGIQSAKGISIVKRPTIALPKRRLRPEDNLGDKPSNYMFSGVATGGDGSPHTITGDIKTESAHTSQNRAMGIMDMHAYFFNYANNQPFIAHTKDYDVPEDSRVAGDGNKSTDTPRFSELKSKMLLDANAYKKKMYIDGRYKEQDFYTLPCGLELLEDGGVVIFDGFGGEIRMTGGSVTISAPGDIWLKSGRSTNVWGGDDINMRAFNSVDIVATSHDVRLKSEKNMQLIAGNSGTGGMLLESRTAGSEFDFSTLGEQTGTSGILMRAPKSVVATLSQDVYLRTGSEDGTVGNGRIVLDAAKGKQEIITISHNVTHFVDKFVRFAYGPTEEPTHVTYFSTTLSTIACDQLMVGGHIAADGNAYINGSIMAIAGSISSTGNPSGLIGDLNHPDAADTLARLIAYIEQISKEIEELLTEAVKTHFVTAITDGFYTTGKIGDDATIKAASASLRVHADYGAGAFIVFEDRWQQLARLNAEQMAVWEENAVTHPKGKSYPYPGDVAFAESAELLFQQDALLFNVQSGHSHPHGKGDDISALYQEPKFAVHVGRALSTYTVVGGS